MTDKTQLIEQAREIAAMDQPWHRDYFIVGEADQHPAVKAAYRALTQQEATIARLREALQEAAEWADRHGMEPHWLKNAQEALEQ